MIDVINAQANTSQNNPMYFQIFQVTKNLTQGFMQNQLLVLPLAGLPQILKPIFSILLSLPGRFIPTSDQESFRIGILPEWNGLPYNRQLPAIFRVCSFSLYFTARCQNAIRPREQRLQRDSPPRHPSAMGEDKHSFLISFLSLVSS